MPIEIPLKHHAQIREALTQAEEQSSEPAAVQACAYLQGLQDALGVSRKTIERTVRAPLPKRPPVTHVLLIRNKEKTRAFLCPNRIPKNLLRYLDGLKTQAGYCGMTYEVIENTSYVKKGAGGMNLVRNLQMQRHEPILRETREELHQALNTRIDDLELGARTYDCLINRGVNTLGDLIVLTEGRLRRTKNFGSKSLVELLSILEEYGLAFGMDMRGWKSTRVV